jgi:uncharacterized protein (TIGR03435 family)
MIERKGAKAKAALGIVLGSFPLCLTAVVAQGRSFVAATIKSTPPGGGPTQETVKRLTRTVRLYSPIQEQLGLKLEPGRGSVEALVIDSAQKPSDN